MDPSRRFAPVARALRDEIIDHYRDRGQSLGDEAGLRTLDTNSTLAAERGALLVQLYRERSGRGGVEGLRVAELGCGFGSLALYFAVLGASVVGVDANEDRLGVPARLAERFELAAAFQRGWIEELALPDESVDLAILNNSLCYLVDRPDRRRAIGHVRRVLVPGGWAVTRNPSRSAPLDPFTGLPLVHQLPPRLVRRVNRRFGQRRSDVRLLSARAARREWRRGGFEAVRSEQGSGLRQLVARYHHVTARRPLNDQG